MFEPVGDTRSLPYPLKDQETNGNTTDDLGLVPNDFIWPEDPEERTVLPLYLSQREFTAIASAVDVGADIAYPLQYIEVWWLLVRNLRYLVPICSLIIPCIEDDLDTQNAIANALAGNTVFNEYLNSFVSGLTGGQTGQKLIGGDCDNSVVMGKIVAIVDRMDTSNRDFLEILEVSTNDEEKMAAVIGAIPGLETLPIDDAIDFMQDLSEDFAENYAAQVTEELKLEWYCGLYCKALENPDCSLTYKDIFDYFQERASSGLTIGSLIGDVVEFIITGSWSGSQVADGMMALNAALVRVGKSFGGINLPSIALATRDADPSSLWEECDACAPHPLVPVINSVWDPLHIAGTLEGPDEEGFYVVTTEYRSATNDEAFTIMAETGELFQLLDYSYPLGLPTCQVLVVDEAPIYIGCDGTNHYDGQSIDEFHSTWTAALGTHTFKFKMYSV